jgi:serine phosphatase RsbU (regulator of sigma subunit)
MGGPDLVSRLRRAWQAVAGQSDSSSRLTARSATGPTSPTSGVKLDIAPNDPIVAYFQTARGPVEIDGLRLDSPALRQMMDGGIKLAVPLVSQGEFVGLLGLGSRLSEQGYSADDRALLANLASQAAPALRVAQLVRQHQAEALARERIENELRVAQEIQQTLLPKALPDLAGWRIGVHYRPAREVGGDFYDFIDLPDGRVGLIIGDVTDKGVPAALVMATTRAILRSTAARVLSPGEVLASVNDALCPDIPARMFVTCLYAILDPASGHLLFANAGHDPPYQHGPGGVHRLWAAGMPLGLMPGMSYNEAETRVPRGDSVLLYSDGMVEAHNPERSMFGFPRLESILAMSSGGLLIDHLLDQLADFVGPEWEQEDDVTMVTVSRSAVEAR